GLSTGTTGENNMEVMLAYDHSRNARIALDAVKRLFAHELPTVTLISVIEEPGSSTSAGDEMFEAQFQEQKAGAEAAAAELSAAGFPAKVLFAEGDARKMILRATEERRPDVLVMARHSYKPDGNFITRRLDALVEEFDHMTFGSVSAFLARRVMCPLLIVPTHGD
ncbi:MAG: universal stress protein, partial [Hydrogenophaga sp.]|nr:universal stress protein [Hydrogenophaga sp.]